jgi:Predicted site-specific integrase-resolvase
MVKAKTCAEVRTGELITLKEACEAYGLSMNTLYDWTKKQKLACERINNKLLIYKDSLLLMLKAYTPRPEKRRAEQAVANV